MAGRRVPPSAVLGPRPWPGGRKAVAPAAADLQQTTRSSSLRVLPNRDKPAGRLVYAGLNPPRRTTSSVGSAKPGGVAYWSSAPAPPASFRGPARRLPSAIRASEIEARRRRLVGDAAARRTPTVEGTRRRTSQTLARTHCHSLTIEQGCALARGCIVALHERLFSMSRSPARDASVPTGEKERGGAPIRSRSPPNWEVARSFLSHHIFRWLRTTS